MNPPFWPQNNYQKDSIDYPFYGTITILNPLRHRHQSMAHVMKCLLLRPTYCLISFALIAGLAVCAGEYLANLFYFKENVCFSGPWEALVYNIAILLSFTALLFSLTNRRLWTLLTSLIFYGLLITSNILKLRFFDSPLRPSDLNYLADLRLVAQASLTAGSLLGILAASLAVVALLVFLWIKDAPVLTISMRIGIGTAATCVLIAAFTLPSDYTVRDWLNQRGIERPEAWQFDPRYSVQRNGLLLEWAMSAIDSSLHQPEGYSRSEIERIAHAYPSIPTSNDISKNQPPINLIIYIIESFMDPTDLGVRFTADPIPYFHSLSRKYSSGKAVVPVFGGTSTNTEFELLTGLSMYFLPDSSCPYRQYLMQAIPSLPRILHQNGYQTTAIPADPPYLFNRKAAYGHLGFDHWIFPEADPQTPRSADDAFASDDALVDAVIASSKSASPYFILAFTGGTHFPWDYSDYDNSKLDISGPKPKESRSKLKTYINALKVADNALKKLITHFSKTDQKTAILILGDHLPALGDIYDSIGFFGSDKQSAVQKRYKTPMVLWSNFPAAKEDFTCSTNFVPVRLLQFLGLKPAGNMALTADVYAHFPVLSNFIQTSDGLILEPQSENMPFPQLLYNYQLIQYDLLLGKQYSLGIWRNSELLPSGNRSSMSPDARQLEKLWQASSFTCWHLTASHNSTD
jgi:glucan phosphoethanolaminetransferase (alkaline phosphatase superfamily)